MTGPNRDNFSGAFAVTIDFTSQVALIDGAAMAPFQIAAAGVPLFQHDWDNLDFDELPLDIRGASNLTIRTFRPPATRLDPMAAPETAPRSAPRSESGAMPFDDDDSMIPPLANNGIQRTRAEPSPFFKFVNISIFVLLAAIAVMLAYSIISSHTSAKKRAFREEDRPTPLKNKVIIHSMTEKPAPVPIITSVPAQTKTEIADNAETITDAVAEKPANTGTPTKDQQVLISKILKLMKEEFVIVDEKIEILSKRISELEKIRK
jgi:hypothetical protein